jgi:hypothetical protein
MRVVGYHFIEAETVSGSSYRRPFLPILLNALPFAVMNDSAKDQPASRRAAGTGQGGSRLISQACYRCAPV